LPYEERSTMAGLPPRLGVGWSDARSPNLNPKGTQDIALESSLINVMAMKKDDLISKWLGTRQARHPKLEGVLPPLTEPEPSQPSKPKKAKKSKQRMQERWQQLQDKWAEEKQKRKDRRRQKLQGAVAVEEPEPAPPEPQQPEPPLGHYRPGASYGLRHAIHSPRQQDDWVENSGAVPRPGRHE
ncbi:Eef2k, partial [Symbiodinium sp. KB8]